jgi:hypothetical protein
MKEKKPMEASQTTLSSPPSLTLPEQTIAPSQVWIHLTEDQQHQLLEAVVLICQEIVPQVSHLHKSEVPHE